VAWTLSWACVATLIASAAIKTDGLHLASLVGATAAGAFLVVRSSPSGDLWIWRAWAVGVLAVVMLKAAFALWKRAGRPPQSQRGRRERLRGRYIRMS
jgi:hypothetical protein